MDEKYLEFEEPDFDIDLDNDDKLFD